MRQLCHGTASFVSCASVSWFYAGALYSGCGYALAGRGSFLPASIRTIGVRTFANRTAVFNLETMLTAKVRSEFIGRGKYHILPETTGVDALLTGEVTSVSAIQRRQASRQSARPRVTRL